MIILAIDTAGPICAVCLYDSASDRDILSISDPIGRGHAEHLPIIVAQVLDKTKLSFDQIDRLGVTIGPGSFAGIRVGISFVRALALALNIPAVGISTLKAMATELFETETGEVALKNVLVIQDARRGEFYITAMSADQQYDIAPKAIKQETISDILATQVWTLCGSGVDLIEDLQNETHTIAHKHPAPSIQWVARLTAHQTDLKTLPRPQYLRAADAKKPTQFVLTRA